MIYLGADHGGFELKETIKQWLMQWKFEFEDCGAFKLDPEDDYPQFAFAVAEKVAEDFRSSHHQMSAKHTSEEVLAFWKDQPKGILICRSAGGVIIAANKVKGIRAVAVQNVQMAKHAREHNNANIIGISGDWTSSEQVKEIVRVFIETEFSSKGRHKRRIEKIKAFEDRH